MSKTVKNVTLNEEGFTVTYASGWSEQFRNVDPAPYIEEAENNK